MIIRSFQFLSRLPLSRHFRSIRNPSAPTFTSSTGALATPVQSFSSKSPADEKVEQITELYATAKDEFEIASEETEKKTVYAADDRAAAAKELAKLKAAFEEAVQGEGGKEIQRRAGGRVRELERAVEVLEERARED